MRNISLENSYTKCGGITIPRPFSLKFIKFVSMVCQVEGYQNILKLSRRSIAFTSYKAFLINKKWSGTSLSASSSVWCLKKNISFIFFYWLTKFHCLVAFTLWDMRKYVNMCMVLFVNEAVTSWILNLALYFKWGLQFSSYEIELRSWVTQNYVTLRATNSNIVIEILLSSY